MSLLKHPDNMSDLELIDVYERLNNKFIGDGETLLLRGVLEQMEKRFKAIVLRKNELRRDLKWALGQMNLAYYQKGDEQIAIKEKYVDIIKEIESE